MVSAVVSAVFVLALASNSSEAAGSSRAGSPAVAPPSLKSVQRLSADLSKERGSTDEVRRVAAEAELAELSDSVIGDGRAGMASRDALAYQMLALGYSTRETADVVSERISRAALDRAHRLRLVGQGQAATAYLASQYRRSPIIAAAPVVEETVAASAVIAVPVAEPVRVATAAAAIRAVAVDPIEAAIMKYSRVHAVDPALIRAVVRAESAFDRGARSGAGAVGLMQLMPATARALGVNPHITDENIEGGVRYLSELLKMFGGVELALIAYNAGPGFAARYAKGQASLYGETRDYVRQVLARLRGN